jgi:tRNA wybutosine-synthesizing protein 3
MTTTNENVSDTVNNTNFSTVESVEQTKKAYLKDLNTFEREKAKVLSQLLSQRNDKSRAGALDPAIVSFVETINSKANYYTTSSCAGRLIVVLQSSTQLSVTPQESMPIKDNGSHNQTGHPERKERTKVEWIYVTHEENSTYETLWSSVTERLRTLQPHENNSETWFKLEPPILAIRAKDVTSAVVLLNYARANHLKNSAIRSVGNDNRVNVTLIDTHRIETLIALGNRMLIDEEYLKILVSLANTKLKISRQRFERLRVYLQNKLN